MIFGTFPFFCPECKLFFEAPYIEYNVLSSGATPMPCPRCGTICGEHFPRPADTDKEEEAIDSTVLKEKQYDGSLLETLEIEDGVKEIKYQCIQNCPNLRKLVIPASVTKIGYGFCLNCRKLSDVRFLGPCPEGLERAFEGCISLHDISVPAGQEEAYMEAVGTVYRNLYSWEQLHFYFIPTLDEKE